MPSTEGILLRLLKGADMPLIDINSPVGLLRMRCGDTRDIPILPDDVYEAALTEKNGNLKSAAILCGNYILAQLAFDGQQQMGIITVYGNHVFQQYKEYLMLMVKDPGLSDISPIPYSGDGGESPLVKFTRNWHKCNLEYCGNGGWVILDEST
jgi:hypothetical protein